MTAADKILIADAFAALDRAYSGIEGIQGVLRASLPVGKPVLITGTRFQVTSLGEEIAIGIVQRDELTLEDLVS